MVKLFEVVITVKKFLGNVGLLDPDQQMSTESFIMQSSYDKKYWYK